MSDNGTDLVGSLLADLARTGIRLALRADGDLTVTAPKGALSTEFRARITAHKAALLDRLAQARSQAVGSGADEAAPPTVVADDENLYEPFPPSDLQQSFLIGSREGFEFFVRPHQYMELDLDELDPARFEEAFNRALVPQLKNVVVVREDMLLQTVRDPAPVRVTVSDLRGLSAAEADAAMADVRAEMQRQQPDHDRWPWMTPHISLYGQGRARLHYNNNSLFTDAPSGVGLVIEALRLYQNPDQGQAVPEVSFRDCVLALNRLEDSAQGQASKRYWCERMPDWPGAPELPLVAGTEHRGRSLLSRRELLLEPEVARALKAKADARGLTLTNALLGAHAEVFSYWSGSRHFLLNNMITHRQLPVHPQIGLVLGNFASLYPLEVDWRHDEPFADRARRLQAQVMRDMAHAYWSGSKVLQTLNQIRRTPGRAVCPYAVGSALFVGGTKRPFYSLLETPQTLLDTEYWQLDDGGLWVTWDVIEQMFPDGLIDAMMAGYGDLVHDLAHDDAAWDRIVPDLLAAPQREQRRQVNASAAPVPDGLLHGCLPDRAERWGDRSAVVTTDAELTYTELWHRTRRLAAEVSRHVTAAGDLVAVVLPKGADQVVAVLGALTAGAAYVPVDPTWPAQRIRYLLDDMAARAVITSDMLAADLGRLTGAPVVVVDPPGGATHPPADPGIGPAGGIGAPRQRPEDVAYVIYTSGSTGRPKGAVLNHRGPLGTIVDINRRFGVGPDDVLFGVSSLCFDLSVYDVFGALDAGATLVLPTGAQTEPESWLDLVGSRGVTVWNSVPAIMQLFVEAAASAGVRFPALRTVLLSGDWIPVDLPGRIRAVAPNAQVISLGGATEASIWSIFFPIDEVDSSWSSIPYGRPLAHQTWHVLDDLGRDAPTWVPGHLYIGGSGLAVGYLNDRDKTEAAFVAHPRSGERLYRTGDLGRYLPDGTIEFLGRADFQVKIQGFRVEPGEVEHALLEHPGVGRAAVVARSTGSGRQLAAFVVGRDGGPARDDALAEDALRAYLAGRLPRYLIPSQITVLGQLPLTANGKLDRPALEALGHRDVSGDRGIGGAHTATETALVRIWESILSVRPIGVHDDFFDLGGQSFAALRMIGQIAQALGRRVPLGTLLECRTIARLASWLETPERNWSPLVRLREAVGARPWLLVHPAGGNVLCYRDLAGLLDRPCLAAQAPGPANGRRAMDKVEDLAGLYVQAIREAYPHGPYSLAGWSSGAVIAAEMARQLEDGGDVVDRLLVIDSPAPLEPRPVDDALLVLWFLEDLDVGFDLARVTGDQLRHLGGLADSQRLAYALDLMRDQGVGHTDVDLADLAATFAVFQGVVRACGSYTGSRIAADITVLKASRAVVSEFADHPSVQSSDWGWAGLTHGRCEAAELAGTHYTLLTERRAVETVAHALNNGIRGIRSGDGR